MQSQLSTVTVLFALFISTAVFILLAFEAGLRLGRWRSRQPDPEPQLSARMIIGSVLGLLAFVLGFTFSVASSHFDARNDALDDEAIAIATAYHRAELLQEPERTSIRALLRRYIDLRLDGHQSADIEEMIRQVRMLQDQMWSEAIAAQKKSSGQPPPAIVFQAINEVIDVNAERVLRNMQARIPAGVWVVLYGIAAIAVVAAGYHSGLTGARRRSFASIAYALAFAGVIVMIADADIPRFGRLQENRQALTDLQTRLGNSQP
ncbi:MAG TPA: hypothetical protein VGK48_23870 [Terriglobia bacterium]|jgi:Tfp pilus assembly protein PilN